MKSQISMFIPKMFAKAFFRPSRQWWIYLFLAVWSFPADGALACGTAGRALGCATAACHFLCEAFALQIHSAGRVALTWLCVWLVQEPKLGWTLECLEKSGLWLSMQRRNSFLWGSMILNLVFPLVVFSEMFLSLESCRYSGILVTPFPTVLNLQNGKEFPVFLELIRKTCFSSHRAYF